MRSMPITRASLPVLQALEFVVTWLPRASWPEMRAEMPVQPQLMAPNGYLHAGSLITLADTMCGYGCLLNLPEGAGGFTTVELKSNHLGTTLDGTVAAVATPVHLGRTTQVWDAVVTHVQSARTLALFRCTQMVLYAKGTV